MSAIDQLDRIHRQYSYHTDSLINKVIKGHEGAEKIAGIKDVTVEEVVKVALGNAKKVFDI